MSFHYAGFNTSTLFHEDENITFTVNSFTKVPIPGITGFQIGWGYFLVWKEKELYISTRPEESSTDAESSIQPIKLPEKSSDRYIQVQITKRAYV